MRSSSIIKSICDLDILRWLYSNSLIKPQIQSQQHEQTITQDLQTNSSDFCNLFFIAGKRKGEIMIKIPK